MCVLGKQNVLYFLYKCTTERLILNFSLVNHIIFRNDYFFQIENCLNLKQRTIQKTYYCILIFCYLQNNI